LHPDVGGGLAQRETAPGFSHSGVSIPWYQQENSDTRNGGSEQESKDLSNVPKIGRAPIIYGDVSVGNEPPQKADED
jgi:hypothetical protein